MTENDLLHKKSKKKNLIGLIIFNFGIGAYWMVENFWINLYWTRNVDPRVSYVGLMVALSAFIGIITQIIFGALSDSSKSKHGRRRPFMLFAAITGGIAMCFFPLTRTFSILLMAVMFAIIMDALITFFGDISTPPRMAFLAEWTELKERGKINAIMGIAGALSMFTVVAFSGYIIDFAGPDFVFYYAGIALIMCGIIFFIISEEPQVIEQKKSWIENLKETYTLESYRQNKSLYILLLFLFINTIGVQVIIPYIFIYIEATFGITGMTLAFVLVALGGISFLLSFIIGILVDKFGRKIMMYFIAMIGAISAFCFAFIPINQSLTLVLIFVIGGLMVGSSAAIVAISDTWMQDLAPEDRKGSMLAYKITAIVIPMIPGALIGGFLADYGPKPAGYFYSPVIFIVSAIFMLCSIPFLKNVEETLIKNKI